MNLTGLACSVLFSLAAASAAAGSFSVAPTRVEFDANRRTAAITLRNADTTAPLTIQASLVAWTQEGAEDAYADTRDLLATPPVFTIPPGGEQVVRLALRRQPDARNELPYRIFFQEVPQAGAAVPNTLNIALRVGVPVFVLASRPDEGMYLDWRVTRTAEDELTLSATNSGGTHVQVTGLTLLPGSGAPLPVNEPRYVLPDSRVSWTVKVPPAFPLADLRVDGKSDMGEFAAEVQAGSVSEPAVRTVAR
jgi:fimbrial chaperone protein